MTGTCDACPVVRRLREGRVEVCKRSKRRGGKGRGGLKLLEEVNEQSHKELTFPKDVQGSIIRNAPV